eukprot:m.19116 g.19116  ORF g.19116 m.19116 type:complete len:1269 (+) comp27790_c0_seq3:144-3950(+)
MSKHTENNHKLTGDSGRSMSKESIISMELPRNEFDHQNNTSSTRLQPSERPIVRSFLSPKKREQRPLLRRSSVENFGRFGLLTPALALLPAAEGQDELTKRFEDLQGSRRELLLAAAHVEDALKGRGRYGKARAMFKPKYAQRCFDIINHKWFHRLIFITVIVHSSLVFGERPSLNNVHPSVLVLNALCLLVYVLDIALTITFMNWKMFWTLKETVWNRGEFFLLTCFCVDFIIQLVSVGTGKHIIQPFRCLRAAMLFCKAKNIRHIFGVFLSITTKLGKVFFLIFLFILVFAAIGLHVFMDDYHCDTDVTSSHFSVLGCVNPSANASANATATATATANTSSSIYEGNATINASSIYEGSYNNLGIAALRLFVLLTTENYPDIFLPAWTQSKLSWFFYGAFIYIGVFILTAILLAIIVDAYWTFSKVHVKEERAREREELAKAWNLLDPLGIGDLPRDDPKFLQLFRILKPKHTDDENRELIYSIDTEMDGFIDSWQWTTNLREVLLSEFERESEDIIPNAGCIKHLKTFAKRLVDNLRFGRFIVLLIVIHSILFCIKWRGISYDVELGVQIPRTVIVGIFFFEMLLRIIGWGSTVIHNYAEIFDAFLVFGAVGANVAWYLISWERGKGIMVVASSLCVLLRLSFNPPELKKLVVNTAVSFGTIMWDLTILYLIALYVFSVIGMESFYETKAVVDVQKNYQYFKYDCDLGFKDFRCALLMTFQITTSNNWNEIMNGVMLSHGDSSAIYFVLTFCFINLIVMNLFVTLVIEGFNKFSTLAALNSNPEEEEMTVWQKVKSVFSAIVGNSKVSPDEEGMPRSPSFHPGGSAIRMKSRPGSQRNSMETQEYVSKSTITQRRSTERIPFEPNDEEDSDDLFSGFSAAQRREAKLKKKFQKKRRRMKRVADKTLNLVRVLLAFKSTKDSEISLDEGEEVEVIEEIADVGWMKGKKKSGEVGWFPVKHVKKLAEERNGQQPSKTKLVLQPMNGVPVDDQTKLPGAPETPKPETPKLKFSAARNSTTSVSGDGGLQSSSHAKTKLVRNKGASDWRRGILGDMTVMNPEEMKRLNAVLKKEMRDRTGKGRNRVGSLSSMPVSSSLQPESALPGLAEESLQVRNENPLASKSSPSLTNSSHSGLGMKPLNLPMAITVHPSISVETMDADNALKEEDSEGEDARQLTSGSGTLTVPGLPQPPKKPRPKTSSGDPDGEIPDWVRRFQQQHALEVKVEDQGNGDGGGSSAGENASACPDNTAGSRKSSVSRSSSPMIVVT